MRHGSLLLRLIGTVVLGVAVVAAVPACSSPSAQAQGQHLSVAAFADAIAQPSVVVVDVRTPSEFTAGHLANAVNIDVESAEFGQRVAALDPSASYALYCRSGNRSGLALTQLKDAGFTHVVDLSGGIVAWTAAGKTLNTGP